MHSGSLDASLDWYRTIHCPKQLFVAAIFTVMVQSCAEHYGFWCTNNKHLLKAGLYFPFFNWRCQVHDFTRPWSPIKCRHHYSVPIWKDVWQFTWKWSQLRDLHKRLHKVEQCLLASDRITLKHTRLQPFTWDAWSQLSNLVNSAHFKQHLQRSPAWQSNTFSTDGT